MIDCAERGTGLDARIAIDSEDLLQPGELYIIIAPIDWSTAECLAENLTLLIVDVDRIFPQRSQGPRRPLCEMGIPHQDQEWKASSHR